MTRHPSRTAHRATYGLAVLSVCLLAVTGCSADDAPTTEDVAPISAPTTAAAGTEASADDALDGTAFLSPEEADRSDVDSVARTTALILHQWDTTVDRTETAAAIRAIPLMSEAWAKNQVEPERNASQGDWLAPSEHRAYSVPRAVPAIGDVAQDVAPDKAIRVFDVTWRWAARDEAVLTGTGHRQVTLYLEDNDNGWEVVGHQTRDLTAAVGGQR